MNTTLSIIVPLFNEEESLQELSNWIDKVANDNKISYELIFIDDGSTDKSWSIVNAIKQNNNNVKGISFRRNYGKSAALNVGFTEASGDVVITMDADLQDSPDEIPELLSMILNDGYDIVSGWKKNRKDPLSKTIPTKLYNAVTRKVSGLKLHDMNCGLKAYRKDVVKNIEVYGEMHRYIPLIAKWAGFQKITEKVVQHQARKYGETKFGLERFVFGFLDLFSITFIGKFGKRPMHLFGSLGTLMFLIGAIFLIIIGVDKLFLNKGAKLIANRTEFYVAITSIIIGVQLFIAGFLGEMLARNSPKRNTYHIREKINFVYDLNDEEIVSSFDAVLCTQSTYALEMMKLNMPIWYLETDLNFIDFVTINKIAHSVTFDDASKILERKDVYSNFFMPLYDENKYNSLFSQESSDQSIINQILF